MCDNDQNWDFQIHFHDNEKPRYIELELIINSIDEKILKLIQVWLKCQTIYQSSNLTLSHDEELKSVIERNKQLRTEIDSKIQDLSQQTIQYEKFKTDQKLLSQEIKETHEAFLMAKKYYKKYLKIYYTIESKNCDEQTIFMQFFTEARMESENFSMRLKREAKSGSYHLLSTHPKLHYHTELQSNLQKTNDVPGVLCSIRQAFITLKMNKK